MKLSQLKSIIRECIEEMNEGPARDYRKKIKDASHNDELSFSQDMKRITAGRIKATGGKYNPKPLLKRARDYVTKYNDGKVFSKDRNKDLHTLTIRNGHRGSTTPRKPREITNERGIGDPNSTSGRGNIIITNKKLNVAPTKRTPKKPRPSYAYDEYKPKR